MTACASTHRQPAAPISDGNILLRVKNLRKSFGSRVILRDISFAVNRGSVFTVLGPSGAGKSVLLKCLANILEPDAGDVFFDGRPMDFRRRESRRAFRSRCSFLFQGNALFDSLTALENVALPLEQTTNLSRPDIRARSLEALEQLELQDYSDHYPGTLSGGMQKRLALARAIVTRPEMVFFDEPTAGLDPLRRNAVFAMIAKYQKKFGFTALIVTHDVAEAVEASCHVALLYHGEICFCGTSAEFEGSDNPVVASFCNSRDALRASLSAVRRGGDTREEEDET